MEDFTPEYLRLKIHKWINAAGNYLSRATKKAPAFFLLFLTTLYGVFFYCLTLSSSFNNNATSFFEARYFWIIPTTTVTFGVVNFVLDQFKIDSVDLKLIIIFCIALISVPEVLSYSDPAFVPILYRLGIILTLSINTLVLVLSRHTRMSIKILLFFATELFIIFYLQVLSIDEHYLASFWITQPMRYVFVISFLSASIRWNDLSPLKQKNFWSYLFTPTTLITPLPISLEAWAPGDKSNLHRDQGRASVYLCLGLLSLVFTFFIQMLKSSLYQNIPSGFVRSVLGGSLSYLYYYTFSFTNIIVPVSLLWWLGLKIPDPYDTPLLATTPQDRWRRWNFLFYEWYFRFVFFPVYKKTRRLSLAVGMSFFATTLIHLGPRSAEFAFVNLAGHTSGLFKKKIIFFMAHGLLVYLGLKFEKSLPKPTEKKAWFSVVAMFVIMSFVHYIFFR